MIPTELLSSHHQPGLLDVWSNSVGSTPVVVHVQVLLPDEREGVKEKGEEGAVRLPVSRWFELCTLSTSSSMFALGSSH